MKVGDFVKMHGTYEENQGPPGFVVKIDDCHIDIMKKVTVLWPDHRGLEVVGRRWLNVIS